MKQKNDKQPKPEASERNANDIKFREALFEVRADDKGVESVSMSVSSEAPVLTYVYFNNEWQRCWEILDHSPSSIDMSRCKDGLVILDQHWGDQIGLMAVENKDRKLGGTVEFCTGARAQEIKQDAIKKLRRNTSVGYRVNADSYRPEGFKDEIPVVRAMSWMPYEASFVPVPADPGVGVGRAEKQENQKQPPATAGQERHSMTPKEIAALFARAAKYGIESAKVEALVEGENARSELDALIVAKQEADAESARKEIEALKTRKPDRPAAIDHVSTIESPAIVGKTRGYSLMNVCKALAGESVDIGFEREMSQELGKQRGKPAKGLIIPFSALSRRDLSVAGTSSATVATILDSSSFIDLLRTKYVLGMAGVTFMPGVTGNLSIPKMTAGATAYDIAEGADLTESTPTLGNVTGTPHTIGAIVDVTRRMLEQSTPEVENMVRNEINQRLLRGLQIRVFAGTGSDGQPSAITAATGINNPSVTAGTPTYAELLNFPGSIMADNAESGAQKWIGTAEVWAKLAATAINGNGSALALDPFTNKLIGRDFLTTEDIPANSLWYGDWSTVVIPFWGNGIEIASDSAKLFASGGLTLRALLDYDVMVRNGYALAYNTAVTA